MAAVVVEAGAGRGSVRAERVPAGAVRVDPIDADQSRPGRQLQQLRPAGGGERAGRRRQRGHAGCRYSAAACAATGSAGPPDASQSRGLTGSSSRRRVPVGVVNQVWNATGWRPGGQGADHRPQPRQRRIPMELEARHQPAVRGAHPEQRSLAQQLPHARRAHAHASSRSPPRCPRPRGSRPSAPPSGRPPSCTHPRARPCAGRRRAARSAPSPSAPRWDPRPAAPRRPAAARPAAGHRTPAGARRPTAANASSMVAVAAVAALVGRGMAYDSLRCKPMIAAAVQRARAQPRAMRGRLLAASVGLIGRARPCRPCRPDGAHGRPGEQQPGGGEHREVEGVGGRLVDGERGR